MAGRGPGGLSGRRRGSCASSAPLGCSARMRVAATTAAATAKTAPITKAAL